MTRLPALIALVTASLLSTLASAQDVATVVRGDASVNAVSLGTSMDPAITVDLGYTRHLDVRFGSIERDLALSAEWAAIPGMGSWDTELAAAVRIRDEVGPDLLFRTALTLKRVENVAHEGFAYGYETGLYPGYYGQHWYVASELAIRQAFAMSISHTDAYRAIHPGAEDGTYMLGGFSTFVGVGAGTRVFDNGMIGLRVAWRTQNLFESYAPYYAPYTATLHVGHSF